MNRNGSFVASVVAVASHRKRVWVAQAAGNLALLALFYGWLRMPDQNGWEVAATVLLGVVIAIATLALHGGTLVYFRQAHEDDNNGRGDEAHLRSGCGAALSRWFPLAVWTAILLALLWLVHLAWDYNPQLAGWLRHLLPGFLRRGVSVRMVDAHLDMVAWFCAWILVPLLLLPLAAQVANTGWRGFLGGDMLRALRSFRYWLMAVVLLLVGGRLPVWIALHASHDPSSTVQASSMAIRFLLAYLLMVTSWVLFCSLLGWFGKEAGPAARRKPDESGPDDGIGVREPVGVSPPGRHARAAADLE